MSGRADCPSADLTVTRAGLHRVAKNLLAAVRYAETGEIGLEPVPGGFRTPVLYGGLVAAHALSLRFNLQASVLRES